MSRSATIDLLFAGALQTFRLGWGELIELQEHRDAGPYIIYQRLMTGAWQVEDIKQVIRLGLIGGGLSRREAEVLAKWVEEEPLLESLPVAQAVMAAALAGIPDEPGKTGGEATPASPSPTVN